MTLRYKMQLSEFPEIKSYILSQGYSVFRRKNFFYGCLFTEAIHQSSGSRFRDFFVKTTKESKQPFWNHSIEISCTLLRLLLLLHLLLLLLLISSHRVQRCSVCTCQFRVLVPGISLQHLVSSCSRDDVVSSTNLWWCASSILNTSVLMYGGRRCPCWPGRRPIRYGLVVCCHRMVSLGQNTTWRSPSLSRNVDSAERGGEKHWRNSVS